MYSCSAQLIFFSKMSAVDPKVKNTANTSAIEPFIYSCSAN